METNYRNKDKWYMAPPGIWMNKQDLLWGWPGSITADLGIIPLQVSKQRDFVSSSCES